MILLKGTRIIRRDMLDTKSKFNGTFNNSCEQESVPGSLKTFFGRIWGGGEERFQDRVKRYGRSADNSMYFSTYSFQCDQKAP